MATKEDVLLHHQQETEACAATVTPIMSASSSFTVTAPGRLCLFGEHQDYLHLPVIALALPLQCRIHCQIHCQVQPLLTAAQAQPQRRVLTLRVPALDQVWTYDLDRLPPRQKKSLSAIQAAVSHVAPDFALAAIHEALDDGWIFPHHGADCLSTTDIPMQAGCSSSSAFCVAWCLVLAKLCGQEEALLQDPLQLARRAHAAEVTHFGAPGGTMDHVTSSLGGVVRIGPDPWTVRPLPWAEDNNKALGCFVLADSGEPKDTFRHLHRCKKARLALLDKLGGNWDSDKDTAVNLDPDQLLLLKATQTNRDMEEQAARAWIGGTASAETLGPKMLCHHEALRDGLYLSTDTLERLCAAALVAGAYGFKVVGSGGGGCCVAWTTHETADQVEEALQKAGARGTWIIKGPSPGVSLSVRR
jgi:galactokinase